MRTYVLRAALAVLAAMLLARSSFAASNDPCSTAQSVSDVKLSLSFKGGRTVYQDGEIIPLVLSFTSPIKGRYWADKRSYDRSGRLETESYCVEPQVPDPLESYFKYGIFIGGGLMSTVTLSTKPFIAEAELNEWRAPGPGHYRLYAVSGRVWRAAGPQDKTQYESVGVVLRSNVVEFDVSPADPEWQREQARKAVATLTGAGTPGTSPITKTSDSQRHAARALRFLRTEEATRDMAQLFFGLNRQQPVGWELMLGLYGSPYSQVAIDALHSEIAAPNHAITAEFLQTLTNLEINADHSWDLPPYDSTHPEIFNDSRKRREAHRNDLLRTEITTAVSDLPHKSSTVRALTLNGLLKQSEGNPQTAQMIRPALIAAWDDLPRETQDSVILYSWPLIACPEMAPILRRIVARPPPLPRTDDAATRDAALKHLVELDRETGFALIREELRNPNEHPSLTVVELLPAEEIRAAVPQAVERIIHDNERDLDFELLDHYGDKSVLKIVEPFFEARVGKWACAPQNAMLRYLLRVAPEYGAREVATSMKERRDTACFRSLLGDLRDELPAAQTNAIAALDDPDPEVVQDAVVSLGRWGTAEAEQALWKRMERFHAQWSRKKDQLRMTPDYTNPGTRGVTLEQDLVMAIAGGVSWICPPEKLERLDKLVLTDPQHQQIESWIRLWKQGLGHISTAYFPENAPTFSVLQYVQLSEAQLKEKLGQFPRGTRLSWLFWQPGQTVPAISMARQETAYEAMHSVAEQHGIKLSKANSLAR